MRLCQVKIKAALVTLILRKGSATAETPLARTRKLGRKRTRILSDSKSAEGKKHKIEKKSIQKLKCIKEVNAARSHEGRATTFFVFKRCIGCPKRNTCYLDLQRE